MGSQLPLGIGLSDSAVFATFHPGRNAAVCSALTASAEGHGEPVSFLYGATGAGKTHLLQAACAAANASGRRAAYLPLQGESRLAPAAVEGWERFDLVCVDDMDSIGGNRDWESALFALFNALRAEGGVWMAAGADVPSALGVQLADLASRLASGPVYQLHGLDDPGRVRALQLRATQRGLELPDEVGQLLIKHLPRDMNTLYQALTLLDRASLVEQRRLTLPFVRSVLGL